MTFHVGQKVVCVNDSVHWSGTPCPLKRDSIYTISAVFQMGHFHASSYPACDVAEAPAPDGEFHLPAYHPRRFRPVVERKTDISIFISLLNTPDDRVITPADKQDQVIA